MKAKTLSLLIVNALFISIAIIALLVDIPEKILISIASSAIAIVSLLLLTTVWLGYISEMVNVTAASLGKNNRLPALSFKNLDELQINNVLIKRKFQVSAESILKLKDPENNMVVDESLRQDKIGEAILSIHDQVVKLKKEEATRTWIVQSLANFGEILRNKAEIEEYSQQIINALVRYLKANRGAFFIEQVDEQEEPYLNMVASFGVEQRELEKARIYKGQGLLGECMAKEEIIVMTDIPENYIRISSGLGQSIPTTIVIVPLMITGKFYGAIELATFDSLESYKVDFLKEVSENIASEIAAIKTHRQTQKLLDASTALTLELRESEAFMRTNLDELAIAQKEMTLKQTELTEVLKAIDGTLATAEFDLSGNLVVANEIFLKVLGYNAAEVLGANCRHLMKDDATAHLMWDNLLLGKSFSGEFKMRNRSNKDLWLVGTFNPISISSTGPEKIMMFAQFTSQEKDKINDLNIIVNALKSTLPVVEFNDQFACRSANEKFLKMFGISRLELRNIKIQHFIDPNYMNDFETIQHEILNKDFITLILPIVLNGRIVSYEASVTIARDQEGKVARIILILVKEVVEKVPSLTL